MLGDFIGNLSKARLFDLIKPLVDTKKSGLLVVEGRNRAQLFIEEGSFIHFETGDRAGEEAIPAIMDLDDGQVLFDQQAAAEKRTIGPVTDQVMAAWAQREEEWKRIRKVVPSSESVFSIVVESGGHKRIIQERHWGVLALCNGIRSVSDIAARLGRSLFEVSRSISEMVVAGMIEKAETAGIQNVHAQDTVDESVFTLLQTELTKVMGPIARIIINDTIAAFEESRDAFPKDRMGSFIRTVSEQIAEEQQRDQFGKAVYYAFMDSKVDHQYL